MASNLIRWVVIVAVILIFSSFGGNWGAETQTIPPQIVYRVYLPLIIQPTAYKGLALADGYHFEDVYTLGASWWYDWTPTGGVPMLWGGRPSTQLPQTYAGWILVLNEPNLSSQANVTPSGAVNRLAVLRAYYPDARLLCCGVSIWAGSWMREFYALGGRPDGWHVHAYIESYITPDYIKSELSSWHSLTGGEYWVTEYGSPAGSLADFQDVTTWFMAQSWITRIAAYTNRQPDGVPWAIGEGVEMVNDDGTLSQIGEWYAGYPAP